MPFLSWEEYVFSRNAQNNLDGRLVTFSKAFRETALMNVDTLWNPVYTLFNMENSVREFDI